MAVFWKVMFWGGAIGLLTIGLILFHLFAKAPTNDKMVVYEIEAIKCEGPGTRVTLDAHWWPMNYDPKAQVLYVMKKVEGGE